MRSIAPLVIVSLVSFAVGFLFSLLFVFKIVQFSPSGTPVAVAAVAPAVVPVAAPVAAPAPAPVAATPAPVAAPAPAPTPAPVAPAAEAPAAAADAGANDSKSSTLTTNAWKALEAKDYDAAIATTNKCITLYKEQAVKMQAGLQAPAPKDTAAQLWALNDVGTCYFIQGKALDEKGDKKGATDAYKFLVDNLSFAQCWDPKGWFWKPGDAARKRLAELQFDAAQ